jgi:fatty-acid desaturase
MRTAVWTLKETFSIHTKRNLLLKYYYHDCRFSTIVLKSKFVRILLYILISGFRRDVYEICALLAYSYYATYCCNCLPTFRDNGSVPFSWVKSPSNPVKMGPIRCPETSVNNYHTMPRNIPEGCFTFITCQNYLSIVIVKTVFTVFCGIPKNH